MMAAASPCRTYIVYHHGLFAHGVRSILETWHGVQIVGMESDVGKALKAIQSLRPEVIIVEECTGRYQRMRLGAFLHSAMAGRVVTLNLDHRFATMYQRNRMAVTNPADLVKAINGRSRVRPGRTDGSSQRPSKGKISGAEEGETGSEETGAPHAAIRRRR